MITLHTPPSRPTQRVRSYVVINFRLANVGKSTGEFFLFWDMQKCMNAPILVGLIAGRSAYEIEKVNSIIFNEATICEMF